MKAKRTTTLHIILLFCLIFILPAATGNLLIFVNDENTQEDNRIDIEKINDLSLEEICSIKDRSALLCLARMLEEGEVSDLSRENLEKALHIYKLLLHRYDEDSKTFVIKLAVARVYMKLNNETAVREALYVSDTEPIMKTPSAYIILGDLKLKQGNIDEALTHWRTAWELNPYMGDVNERMMMSNRMGIPFFDENHTYFPYQADAFARWVSLKNVAYKHLTADVVLWEAQTCWIMYELLDDARKGVPYAMYWLSVIYKNGNKYFQPSQEMSDKWYVRFKTLQQ